MIDQNTNIKLIIGALLHDIGKVVMRAENQRVKHSKLGQQFLSQYIQDQDILNMVSYHHYKEISESNIKQDDLAYIVYLADNLASAADRRSKNVEQQSRYQHFEPLTNQADIFNTFNQLTSKTIQNAERYNCATILHDHTDIAFPKIENRHFSQGEYAQILTKIKESLTLLQIRWEHITSLLNLLEATLSFVPSSTNTDEVADISLFDHMKMTAAIATSMYHYLSETHETNYEQLLFKDATKFYNREAFRMVCIDVSGIQDFIYTITDSKAAKMLRARSFYLEMFVENMIDELLSRLALSRANVIYSGGGHAYIIVANTQQSQDELTTIQREINEFLIKEFGITLYVAMASVPFSGNILRNQSEAYSQLFIDLSSKISEIKQQKYTFEQMTYLNQQMQHHSKECRVCHQLHETSHDFCQLCQRLVDISSKLLVDEFIEISQNENGIPIGFDQYLSTIKNQDKVKGSTGRIYAKNKFYFGNNQAIHIWMGDYAESNHYNEFVEESEGIKRIAVLRCDVDNLGQAFIKGYDSQFLSLSRTATFSRNMTLFFKYHINHLMRQLNTKGVIIYAGGDDVFIVGQWLDIILLAIKLREDFKEFSQGKLSLSTGIGIFPAKTPISLMAKQTGKLEEAAKSFNHNAKDAIALFSEVNVFDWDRFILNIWQKKYYEIDHYMRTQDKNYGMSFIYQLVNLLRQRVHDTQHTSYKTISWAQWVYYLSRMEPQNQQDKASFKRFASTLHQYFENYDDALELLMALELYVYTIRGEEHDITDE